MPPPALRAAIAPQVREGCRTGWVLAAAPSNFRFAAIFQAPEGWTSSLPESWWVERAPTGSLRAICFTTELQPPVQEHGHVLKLLPIDQVAGEQLLPA